MITDYTTVNWIRIARSTAASLHDILAAVVSGEPTTYSWVVRPQGFLANAQSVV